MLEPQLRGKAGQIAAYEIERRHEPFLRRIVVKRGFQLPDFGAELLKLARQLAIFGNRRRVLKMVGDPADNTRLLREAGRWRATPGFQ